MSDLDIIIHWISVIKEMAEQYIYNLYNYMQLL